MGEGERQRIEKRIAQLQRMIARYTQYPKEVPYDPDWEIELEGLQERLRELEKESE